MLRDVDFGLHFFCLYRNLKFRPTYGRLREIQALVLPAWYPHSGCNTDCDSNYLGDVIDKLDMKGCKMVCVSPDCPNIYEVRQRSTTDDNLQPIVESLRVERNKANRVIVF